MIESTYIYGKHAVKEALLVRPDVVRSLHLAKDTKDDSLTKLTAGKKFPVYILDTKKLPKGVAQDAVHQGIIAEIDSVKLLIDYDAYMKTCEVTADTAFVLLGEVQDPQNVGAIIRSAVAFGARAILIPEHRQAQVNGTVIKASVGMAFRIPLVTIGNVNTTIKDLKERGFWVYGLTGEAETDVSGEGFEKPSVIIVGNEGSGIREKTLEHCDITLRIPISSNTESLNASVAAGVVLYAWRLRHTQ